MEYEGESSMDVDELERLNEKKQILKTRTYNEYKMSPTSISGGDKLLTGGELISPSSCDAKLVPLGKHQEEDLSSTNLEQRCYNKAIIANADKTAPNQDDYMFLDYTLLIHLDKLVEDYLHYPRPVPKQLNLFQFSATFCMILADNFSTAVDCIQSYLFLSF